MFIVFPSGGVSGKSKQQYIQYIQEGVICFFVQKKELIDAAWGGFIGRSIFNKIVLETVEKNKENMKLFHGTKLKRETAKFKTVFLYKIGESLICKNANCEDIKEAAESLFDSILQKEAKAQEVRGEISKLNKSEMIELYLCHRNQFSDLAKIIKRVFERTFCKLSVALPKYRKRKKNCRLRESVFSEI